MALSNMPWHLMFVCPMLWVSWTDCLWPEKRVDPETLKPSKFLFAVGLVDIRYFPKTVLLTSLVHKYWLLGCLTLAELLVLLLLVFPVVLWRKLGLTEVVGAILPEPVELSSFLLCGLSIAAGFLWSSWGDNKSCLGDGSAGNSMMLEVSKLSF